MGEEACKDSGRKKVNQGRRARIIRREGGLQQQWRKEGPSRKGEEGIGKSRKRKLAEIEEKTEGIRVRLNYIQGKVTCIKDNTERDAA